MPGFVGFPELLLLGLVVLILFGPKRLPEMGRGLGKGMREFKDSISGDTKNDDHFGAVRVDAASEITPDPTVPVSIPRAVEVPVVEVAVDTTPVVDARRDVA